MRILIASSIHPDAVHELKQQHDVITAIDAKRDELLALMKDRQVLIFRSGVKVDAELLSRAPELRLIIRGGCGLDNLDLDYVEQHKIRLERIAEPAAIAVAELTFALMIGIARHVREADTLLRQGKWAKKEMTGTLLHGKTLGVIGAGNIGSRVGQLAVAFGMVAIGCVEHPNETAAARLRGRGVKLVHCDELLTRADFISLHVPLKESTRNLIDAHAISAMKQGCFIVNMARGGVVDEDALYDALVSGKVRGAALDVHEREGEGKISRLAPLPNVLLTPHIGSGTFETQVDIGRRVLAIIRNFSAAPAAFAAAD